MERLALTILEAAAAGGPKRSKLYEDIRDGKLRARKFGRSTRILVSDFLEYLASAPVINPQSDTTVCAENRVGQVARAKLQRNDVVRRRSILVDAPTPPRTIQTSVEICDHPKRKSLGNE